jgi:hypothetical protein
MNDQKGGNIGVASISAGRTEAQIAADYRAKALTLLEELAGLLTEARKDHGMTITFQISGADAFGRSSISMLEVAKKLC